MNEKKLIKISLGTAICIFIIFISILLIGAMWYNNKVNNYNEKNNINEPSDSIEGNQDDKIKQMVNFEEALVNYIIESIRVYTKNGYILKDTMGEVTASKLTVQEFENSKDSYKKEIENMLENNSIFGIKFIRNDKECCTYNLEKILNKLDLGTHMGIGIGCYDTKGNKIYEYTKVEVEEYSPTNSNIIKYFGYDTSKLVEDILDEIEICADNNYILKDTTGDVKAQKLTLVEAQNNRQIYAKKINELINDKDIFTEIYFENNKLICKCYFEQVLNQLGIGTHMGVGTNINEEGIQIFTI